MTKSGRARSTAAARSGSCARVTCANPDSDSFSSNARARLSSLSIRRIVRGTAGRITGTDVQTAHLHRLTSAQSVPFLRSCCLLTVQRNRKRHSSFNSPLQRTKESAKAVAPGALRSRAGQRRPIPIS
jgi:hypothetical protein